jgi:2-phosphosulfolactate phosphatase
MRIDLFLVPGSAVRSGLAEKTIVVIDVLRASTTICQALYAGARAVIPFEEPDEVVEMRDKIGPQDTLIAGERDGIKIENFDLGNSPSEFTPETVGGKTIIMTTSNGTRAFEKAGQSGFIITGAMVNISSVARKIAENNRDLVILCAGHKGQFSIEDSICGGMIISKLSSEHKVNLELNDAASLALLLYRSNSMALKETIAQGEHGRFLKKIGFGDDVIMAARPDSIPVLPILKDNRIILERE